MSITKISPSVVDFDDGITISTTDNSDNLTLTSTDTDANTGPVLNLNRAVTGADDDLLGSITFAGQDDANNAVDYAFIQAHLKDASDGAEDGLIDFQVMHAGTSRSALILNGGGTVIVNQDSQDMDFRVESNNNANMLVVDAGNDRVGIGISPSARLHVDGSEDYTGGIVISAGAQLHSWFLSGDLVNVHNVHSASASAAHTWQLNGTEVARITPSGLTFNGDTAAANALDDYEEGTYTVTGYDASSGGNASSTTVTGTYTKIGRQVTVQFYAWNNISTSGMTSGNIFYFTLPFAASAIRAIGAAAHHGFTYDGNTNMQDIKPLAAGSSSRGYFKTVGYGQADSTVKVSDITSGTDDIHTFTLTYTV